MSNSDSPGMILVSYQLTGNNFLSWKRSMMIALGAKTKLGFINGEVTKPSPNDSNFVAWRKVDWMVFSWILNSVSKDIADSFLYAESSKELWEEICQRYGESNGPMKYKLQREITSLTQVFTAHAPLALKLIFQMMAQHEAETKLIQFLMGLNDSFDNTRNQMLLVEPLPTISKAFSMILTAERQRSVQNTYGERIDNVAMMAKTGGVGRGQGRGNMGGRGGLNGNQWNTGRGRGGARLTKEEKAKLHCEKCGMN
ncbi:Unknown protein, partial [Striga hermonthica]